MSLVIHVWSDIVCPWCFVGKRRLQQALAEFESAEPEQKIELVWHSFELDPGARRSPSALSPAQRLAKKYGMSEQQAESAMDQMAATGAKEGISFRLKTAKTTSSFDAHRLLHLARELDLAEKHRSEAQDATSTSLQDALKERLFAAHFSEERDCTDPAELQRLAVEVGLPEDRVETVLASDQFAAEVRADEAAASEMGIRGVPFFVIGSYGISGAQSKDVLLRALDQANIDALDESSAADEGSACFGPDC